MFLIVAVVSIVIVVALFVAAPTGQVIRGATEITYSGTDTTWTCTWDNAWRWQHTYADGAVQSFTKYLTADSINCDKAYWSCENGGTCDSYNDGLTCTCIKQRTIGEPGSSN